jgi:hypothetical protein
MFLKMLGKRRRQKERQNLMVLKFTIKDHLAHLGNYQLAYLEKCQLLSERLEHTLGNV